MDLGRQLSGQKHLLCKHDLNLHPLHNIKTHAFNPSIGVEESGQREMNPKRAPWPVSLIKVMSFKLNESPCHKTSKVDSYGEKDLCPCPMHMNVLEFRSTHSCANKHRCGLEKH